MQFLWVGVGGFFGALARYAVGRAFVPLLGFPWATLVVNVAGSFAIGFVAVVLLQKFAANDDLRLLLMVGFLGSFTTFSSFSLETLTLMQSGAWSRALLNALANVSLCILAVTLGYAAARHW